MTTTNLSDVVSAIALMWGFRQPADGTVSSCGSPGSAQAVENQLVHEGIPQVWAVAAARKSSDIDAARALLWNANHVCRAELFGICSGGDTCFGIHPDPVTMKEVRCFYSMVLNHLGGHCHCNYFPQLPPASSSSPLSPQTWLMGVVGVGTFSSTGKRYRGCRPKMRLVLSTGLGATVAIRRPELNRFVRAGQDICSNDIVAFVPKIRRNLNDQACIEATQVQKWLPVFDSWWAPSPVETHHTDESIELNRDVHTDVAVVRTSVDASIGDPHFESVTEILDEKDWDSYGLVIDRVWRCLSEESE